MVFSKDCSMLTWTPFSVKASQLGVDFSWILFKKKTTGLTPTPAIRRHIKTILYYICTDPISSYKDVWRTGEDLVNHIRLLLWLSQKTADTPCALCAMSILYDRSPRKT